MRRCIDQCSWCNAQQATSDNLAVFIKNFSCRNSKTTPSHYFSRVRGQNGTIGSGACICVLRILQKPFVPRNASRSHTVRQRGSFASIFFTLHLVLNDLFNRTPPQLQGEMLVQVINTRHVEAHIAQRLDLGTGVGQLSGLSYRKAAGIQRPADRHIATAEN